MDKETEQILLDCAGSTEVTARTLFPERFNVDFSPLHHQILDLIDGPHPRVAIAAPRGFGKTSIVALALVARYILFRLQKFVVYINMSFDAASRQTENLKHELITNQVISKIFGKAKVKGAGAEVDEVFSTKAWVAYESLILPRGSGQQVRGSLYKNDRPGLIIIDDLEDPDTIDSEDIRKNRKVWFHGDVLKAVSRLKKDWKIVYIDTLKHHDSLLQELIDSSAWASLRLEACDDDFNPTAPTFMSKEDIDAEVKYHEEHGVMDVFYREFRNLPVSLKDASFKQEFFRRYNLGDSAKVKENDLRVTDAEIQDNQQIENVVILDPAKTVQMQSADSAIVGVGIDLNSAKLYVRDCVSGKMYPDEIYNEIFGMAARLNARVIGIEETSLNEFIKQPIKNEMFKRGKFYELIWLKPRGGQHKAERIKELVPYYRQGHIYHNAACCTKLESQLLQFPKAKLWDLMDCLAYIIQMLELGERYFSPPDEDPKDIESEYKELDYEPPMQNKGRL